MCLKEQGVYMKTSVVDVRQLNFGFDKGRLLFSNVDFSLFRGETVGLVGANGAGKSTLLKLLVGLHEKSSGKIQVCGVEQSKKTLSAIRRKVGFAFQDTDSQLFMTTVYEDVAFGPRNMGVSEETVHEMTQAALGAVKAEHLSQRPPYKLSGGEKRLVALATVLAMEPEIIVLDEPTTGLDPRARRNLIELLEGLSQTKLIATHDMDMALEICDRIIVLNQGEIVESGLPLEIFKNRKLMEKCHLEQPLCMQACPVCKSQEA